MSGFKLFGKKISGVEAYFWSTVSYGLVRTGFRIKDATTSHYDEETRESKQVPMLLCDKVFITALSGFLSTTWWPIFVYVDMRRLEVASNKKLDPKMYGINERRYFLDYIWE